MFQTDGKRLIWRYDYESLWIESWGENALRVRGSHTTPLDDYWALLPVEGSSESEITIETDRAFITNGKIKAEIESWGRVTFYNKSGEILLQEFFRDMKDHAAPSPLHVKAREFK